MANKESNAGRLVKHSTIYAIGNISRQLVGFLMLPLYTHYLTPSDYGVVGLLTFALALLEPLFGARLGDATLKFFYEEQNEAKRKIVLSTSLLVTGSVSTIVATVAFLSRESASQLIFGTAQYATAVGMFAYVFLTQAVEYFGLMFIRIQQRPLLFISINLTKLAFQLALNIYLIVYLKLGVNGVVMSGILSSGLFAAGLTGYTLFFNGIHCDTQVARRMVAFSWPLWLSSLASLYIYSANRYYIRIFSSIAEVGYFELAAKFSSILGLIVWQPFSQFWETERYRQYQKKDAPAIFSSVFEFASTLLLLGALGISIFADPVIDIMSAPPFHDAKALVPWLAFGWLFGFFAMYVNFSFLVTEKTGAISRNNFVTVVLITVLNLLLIPKLGYLGAGIAQLLALVLQFLLVRRASRAHFDMKLKLGPLFTKVAVCVAGYALANRVFHIESIWLDLLWKAAVYIVFALAVIGVLLRSEPNRRQVQSLLEGLVFPILRRLKLMPQPQ